MTDAIAIGDDIYPAEMAGDVREFEGFIRGFLTAADLLDATGDQVEKLLADAFKGLPKYLQRVLIYQGVRREVEEFVDAKIEAGELERLPGGLIRETAKGN